MRPDDTPKGVKVTAQNERDGMLVHRNMLLALSQPHFLLPKAPSSAELLPSRYSVVQQNTRVPSLCTYMCSLDVVFSQTYLALVAVVHAGVILIFHELKRIVHLLE